MALLRSPRPLRPGPRWVASSATVLLAPLGERAQWHQALWELAPARWLRRTPGRETFALRLGAHELVVKRFQGGESRDALRELFRGRQPRSAARREAENLLALQAAGIGAPQVLAWFEEAGAGWSTGRAGYRSALLMHDLGAHVDLRRRLAEVAGERRAALLRRVVELVAHLHAQGFAHRDLYLEHILELADGQLVLIDAGRMLHAQALARRWRIKDLAALQASAPAELSRSARLRLLARYLESLEFAVEHRALRRARLRDWSKAVHKKHLRLVQHLPRHTFDAVRQERGGA